MSPPRPQSEVPAWDEVPRRWRHVPGLWLLRRYPRRLLRGDLLAGITVAAYLIPQVMAYAEVAGLPAIAGLWAVLGPLAVYAVLGSSRQLSVGPESTTALMTAVGVGALSGGDPGRIPSAAAALALAVGVVCLLGWAGRLGFLANLFSRPVLTGYMAGIALLMIVSQLGKITGLPVTGDSVAGELASFARQIGQVHLWTTVLAVTVLAVMFALRRWLPRAPGPLIAMLGSAAVVAAAGLERQGVQTVGEVPQGLPSPAWPDVGGLDLIALAPAALGLAVVAYTDNVLTARAFATRVGPGEPRAVVDTGQEFLALGAANLASGLTQGFPVSSSGSRTAIADSMGARSQLYSLVTLAVVALTLLFLAPALSTFPAAALGGVVIYAATRLIDLRELRRIARFRRSEMALAGATTVAVLAFGVLYGIAVAVGLSIIDLLRRIARPHDGVLGYVPGLAGMHDIDDYPDARQVPGLVVYRYDSPLFFANADDFRERALSAVDQARSPVSWFVLNAEANVEVDLTAVDALADVRRTLAARGIVFAMARVKHELYQTLQNAGFVGQVGSERIFATLPTAVEAYHRWQHDQGR